MFFIPVENDSSKEREKGIPQTLLTNFLMINHFLSDHFLINQRSDARCSLLRNWKVSIKLQYKQFDPFRFQSQHQTQTEHPIKSN